MKELGLFSLKKKKTKERHDNSLQICKRLLQRKKNYFPHKLCIELETQAKIAAKNVFSNV